MSTKSVAVAAIIATVALTTEAKHFDERPMLLDEEQGWTVNAGISGQGGKPAWQVGVSGSWEEEQALKIQVKAAVNTLIKAHDLGLLEEDAVEAQGLGKTLKKAAKVVATAQTIGLLEEESEEQKFKLGKALKKVGNGLVKAREIGLLEEEEEEEQKFKLGKALKKAANVAVKARDLGLLEEDEWTVNAGISGQGGKPSWNVGVSHSWEEEEQKLKLGKALKKAANVAVKAHELGLLEEDFEEEQKWKGWKKLENVVKKAIPVAIEAKQAGLFEEEEEQKFKLGKTLKKVGNGLVKARELGLLEEEEEQSLSGAINCAAYPNAPFCVALRDRWAKEQAQLEEEEQKFKLGKTLKKVGHGLVKARELGLLEEDEWTVNAGISGQGGKPSWQVGVSHSWDEEELEQKWKGWKKIENAAKKAIPVVIEAKKAGLFEEEEYQPRYTIGRPLDKIRPIVW